jgi:hypothetical protein
MYLVDLYRSTFYIVGYTFLKSFIITAVIIISHTDQNPLTANYH